MQVKDAYGNTSNVKLALQQGGPEPAAPVCANTMYPDSRNIFENNQVEFYLDDAALYDEICFRYKELPSENAKYVSNVYQLHSALIPVHDAFGVLLKTTKNVPESLRPKVVMVRVGEGSGASATTLENGWYRGTFRDFGNFHLEIDTVAPRVTPIGIKPGAAIRGGKISFAMHDTSGIKEYRAELDGKWLMFSRKGNVITYKFDEHCGPGTHTLVVKVTDIAGNVGSYKLTFKR
jgi:hypothetical protein